MYLSHICQLGKGMDEILKDYFVKGFLYQKILQLLEKFHVINISMRTLQQRLHSLGLKRKNEKRKNDYINREEVRAAIVSYCNGAGSSGGYRSVWHALKLRGLVVPGRVVSEIYREVDPTGTVERRANILQRRRYVN